MADGERLELTLRRPPVGWFPRPTVVFNGRGQPAQWGTGTWQVSADVPTEVRVYLYNRIWKFGQASITVEPGTPVALVYRAPFVPLGPGRLAFAPR